MHFFPCHNRGMIRKGLLTFALFMTILCGCAPRGKAAEASLFVMDTYCSIQAHGKKADAAVAAAATELRRLDELLSITKPSSDVGRINAADGGLLTVSSDTLAIIETACAVSKATDGAFDITIEPVVRLWGFYDGKQRVPAVAEIDEALSMVDYAQLAWDAELMSLQTAPGQRIDLGGIGKGYASDRMVEIFKGYDVDGALVSLGGNVHAFGAREGGGDWRIGIRDPLDEEGMIAVLELRDQAVITAGSYQRYFDVDGIRYHHIMNPSTGRPADSGLLSVTVIADSGAYADALSTALFVMGSDLAIAAWERLGDFDMILVDSAGDVRYTSGIKIMEQNARYNYAIIVE